MSKKKNNIASSLIPQSNYRKKTNKTLNILNTDIPSVGTTSKHTPQIEEKVDFIAQLIHKTVTNTERKKIPIVSQIIATLFQNPTKKVPATFEGIWKLIEPPVTNFLKIHYLNQHIETLLHTFEGKLLFLINKYKRHLPNHISHTEGDDLITIAQLELIETFKNWNPSKNIDIWPLAYSRINGAMKDHIRYISKSDPSRFYDWVTDAANLYIAINEDNTYEEQVENNYFLDRALTHLNEKEKKVVILHVTKDLKFKDIAERIQLSESQVSRIYKQAVEKIKKAVTKKEN
jgi:RNA polymerase sigma factor (sigma-70 family)